MATSRPPPGYVIKNWTTTYDRISKVYSETYYTNVNLFGKLHPATAQVQSLTHFAAPGRIPYDEAILGPYVPAAIGDSFGPTWSTHWFKIDLDMPVEWIGEHVQFVWDSNSEAMVWKDGEARQGLNHSHGRDTYIISSNLQESERVQTFYVEMAANRLFGAGDGGDIFPPNPDLYFTLSKCHVQTMDPEVQALIFDFETMLNTCEAFGKDSNQGNRALQVANQMATTLDVNDRTTYQPTRDLAASFFSQSNGMSAHTVCAVGNCHIDSAWLWEYEETKRKCARSWSTTIRLMEKYPNFIFACSQAQQFEWVKDNYPALFADMQNFSTQGQFYHVGGTWIEMDGNVPSGEGFIRQFLIGQRFYEQNFGSRCTEFWLPDTFGYSPQLPQIVKLAGINNFVTQKLSWSLVNTFPHNTFYWKGIDSTRLLTHFPPTNSYVMQGRASEVKSSIDNFKDKGRSNHTLYLYGHGDGGQGPDPGMIERLTRLADVDQLPKVEFSTPRKFFQDITDDGLDNLNEWSGELYLELHNGTYTTQAKIKKANRETEFLLSHVETIGTFADVLSGGTGYAYPVMELTRLWKLVLLNQFHDILPGTSIEIAHDAAFAHYDDVRNSGGTILTEAKDAFFAAQNDPSPVATQVLFNLTSWDRTNVVTIPAAVAKSRPKQERQALEQIDKDGNTLMMETVPSMGYAVLVGLDTVGNQPTATVGGDGTFTLDNGLVRAEFTSNGRMSGLFINGGTKNAISPGEFGNQLLFFEDTPMYWDAWDIADYHLETMKVVDQVVTPAVAVENGPLRATVEIVLRVSNSTITQHIMLEAGAKFVKFQTTVDWQEAHKCLKVEFAINAMSQKATYECQYGFLERPTHMNTSWDWAKYEVFGHKWADYSEHNWGVSILNDSKYGWSCLGNKLRLSLLRSPKNPDANSDIGTQVFTYCAFPHDGTFQSSGVVQAGWEVNVPLQLSTTQISATVPRTNSYIQVDNPSVIVGSVKKCEDDPFAFVVRLYEAHGGRSDATVTINNLPSGILQAQVVNILEDLQGSPLPVANNSFTLSFTPHQIQSVKVTFFQPAAAADKK